MITDKGWLLVAGIALVLLGFIVATDVPFLPGN